MNEIEAKIDFEYQPTDHEIEETMKAFFSDKLRLGHVISSVSETFDTAEEMGRQVNRAEMSLKTYKQFRRFIGFQFEEIHRPLSIPVTDGMLMGILWHAEVFIDPYLEYGVIKLTTVDMAD